jgi:hypothetical protein
MRLAYLPIAMAFCLLWIVAVKYRKLTLPKSNTEVDQLDHAIADIKGRLPFGSSIGFRTNTPLGRHGVLYFKTALVLAPVVVENGDSDTILLLEEPEFPVTFDSTYQCISRGGNDQFSFILMSIKR